MMMEIFKSVGFFACSALALVANGSWRFLQFSSVVLLIIGLYLMIFHMRESSRYHMSKNNMIAVTNYLNTMANVNNRDIKVTYLYDDVDHLKKTKHKKGLI